MARESNLDSPNYPNNIEGEVETYMLKDWIKLQ